MKNKIVARLDQWADTKTQEEFDNLVCIFLTAPIFTVVLLVSSINIV